MDTKKVFNSTITNLAYVVAGIAFILDDTRLLPIGVNCCVLGLGSAIHHYHLYNEEWNDLTRRLDYLGMYAVFMAAVLMYFELSNAWILGASLPGAAALAWFAKPHPAIVGVLGGLAALGVALGAGVGALLEVLAWAGVAFAFRQIGARALITHADFLHGVGWHIPTAYMIYLMGTYLL